MRMLADLLRVGGIAAEVVCLYCLDFVGLREWMNWGEADEKVERW